MAAPGGAESTALTATSNQYWLVEQAMREEPWSFHFFQAVRLLRRIYVNRELVGRFVHPSKEIVRFGANTATAFPASQIQDIKWEPEGAPVMIVNFMGLTGPLGVLPLYYSEMIRERMRAKDPTLLAFLNLFNHRMISLFYQAWEKYRFTVPYERGERDRMSQHLMDLIGLGTPGLQNRQQVADDALLFYSGLLSLHTRSSEGLGAILEDYFGVNVEVEQFVGAWHGLSTPDQCCFDLGATFSEQLGVGAVVGDEIWNLESSVRIRLGPLTLDQYLDFLPEGSAYAPLSAIARFFAGDEIDFEVQLVLKRNEVPACELSEIPVERVVPQLGWTTWAKTVPMTRDPGDTILRI